MSIASTLGRRVGLGAALLVLLCLIIAFLGVFALWKAVERKDYVITHELEQQIGVGKLRLAAERKVSASRAYLFTGQQSLVQATLQAREEFKKDLERMRGAIGDQEAMRIVDRIARVEALHQAGLEHVMRVRGTLSVEETIQYWDRDIRPHYDALQDAFESLEHVAQRRFERAQLESTEHANSISWFLIAMAGVAIVVALLLATWLTRAITRQVGSAVQHLQTSSTELLASAEQQATTAKDQATATHEVTTTIKELLATSRQIAESAQRVVGIAEHTADAAQTGEKTLEHAQLGFTTIKHQVDGIVGHMGDLERKSQQIGMILDILNELAEQTNIVAINATIEAVGAGDAGKRFSVVADEIRKLADRAGNSTKEIRGLVNEVRNSVITTMMATEEGSKAVETGARQFVEVTSRFGEIAGHVTNATEAAHEIELITRQQASAVEQVNGAMLGVAQSAKEVEASSHQTVQIADELTTLSRDLGRLVRATA